MAMADMSAYLVAPAAPTKGSKRPPATAGMGGGVDRVRDVQGEGGSTGGGGVTHALASAPPAGLAFGAPPLATPHPNPNEAPALPKESRC